MLDVRFVSENLDQVRQALGRRGDKYTAQLEPLSTLAAERLELLQRTEALQAERNRANDEMSKLAKGPDKLAFQERREALKQLSERLKRDQEALEGVAGRMSEVLLGLPNLPHPSVPDGSGDEHNREVRVWGEPPAFGFTPKPHWDLGPALGILDFERAAKLSGARFAVLFGAGAKLERALIQFMLELHTTEHGYQEVLPPFLVKASALLGTGQLPKFEQELFKTHRADPEDDAPLYLIPTAEVPLTNLHQDEILTGSSLPVAYTAYTPCFRSEAGSYGKDVRGLIRQHQFDKVELVRFAEPENSLAELELLTSHAEAVLQRLGLHYRVVELCAGDLGFSATKCYDIEVWLPSQNAYREISSCSNCGDFQARRAKIRYRPDPKAKPRLVHTLNGSGLAVGRTMIAILEQCQTADGSVIVPEPLRPFLGMDKIEAG